MRAAVLSGIKSRLEQEREAIVSKIVFAPVERKKSIYAHRLGLALRRRRDRIDDRRMRIRRESADDRHVRLDLGIGLVDDAERALRRAPTSVSAARTFSAMRELRSPPRSRSRASPVPLWHICRPARRDVAGRDAAIAGEFGEIEALVDGNVADLGILRRDQHQLVAEQVDARALLDELLSGDVVHPLEVGGGEQVGRCAVLDLLGQCRATPRSSPPP